MINWKKSFLFIPKLLRSNNEVDSAKKCVLLIHDSFESVLIFFKVIRESMNSSFTRNKQATKLR